MRSRIAGVLACLGVATIAGVVALAGAKPARASEFFADRSPSHVSLRVNAKGEALVTYKTETGQWRHVLVWGAINALGPSRDTPQVKMKFDYAGGWRKYRSRSVSFRLNYWKTFKSSSCRPYDGPTLVYFVAACKAPDGSYWALQSWKRLEPLLGFEPWLKKQREYELHISHWTGPLPVLEFYSHWTYRGSAVGVFARFTYLGQPVFGFNSTKTGEPLDNYGRNIYIDTYDSIYGPGWKRESGILTHLRTGTVCHSFVPQTIFPGYPGAGKTRPAAPGSKYRATVMGPGELPIVQAYAPGLGAYDPVANAGYTAIWDRVMAGDTICAPER